MKPIRVLLADDHTLVRAGIRSLLETIEGVQVVAECGDGREALELIERHRPDLALLDIGLLLILIAAFIVSAWNTSRPAALLFVPYFAWVAFATALNAAIWQLNG